MTSLGDRIRERRKELRLSQGDLAERAGVTASFVSQVERGVTSPSIDSLYRISQALEVPVFHFLLEPEVTKPVVRQHERLRIAWPWAGPELSFQLLTPRSSQRLEAFMTEWQPGEYRSESASGFGDATEEFIYVLQGQLEIRLGDEVYLLGPGDTVCFEGVMLRGMEPRGDQTVRFISVITPPAF
ncbi:MAG: helix-turn-helix domain-containing protein [Anaerolineae bacterium]|jgi:transcriptional regulator with XRE-family HTH domain